MCESSVHYIDVSVMDKLIPELATCVDETLFSPGLLSTIELIFGESGAETFSQFIEIERSLRASGRTKQIAKAEWLSMSEDARKALVDQRLDELPPLWTIHQEVSEDVPEGFKALRLVG